MTEEAIRRSRVAGLVLSVTGVLILLGSFTRWTSCPTTPCGGILMSISDYSGIDLGFGKVTALAGLALIAIGLAALHRPGTWKLAGPAAIAAIVVVAATGASIVWMYIIPGEDKEYYWPPFTAMAIGIVGLIALDASRSLRNRRDQVSGNSPT